MNDLHQGWLVAVRELRERARSRAFRASLLVLILVVAGVIVVPALLEDDDEPRDIGLTGTAPASLTDAIEDQGRGVGMETIVRRYDTVAAGQDAVREGDVDVLVVDARRLVWRRQPDEQLRAVVTAAIQVVAVLDRAAAAGFEPAQVATLLEPAAVDDVELSRVAGRTPDDETAVLIMNVLLLMAIATFGGLVLTGVVEEKTTRVVEVLLARIRARTLLAGKVAGIGLLGLGQVVVTAAAALIATTTVDAFDVPAARGAVLAWAIVWFLLGYALYAMAYGVLGSLASRPEDAQSTSGPATVVLIAGYWASFVAIGSPDALAAVLVSLVPPTAPFAMPTRIAMGAAAWWEPYVSAALTVTAVAALVALGGRVYAGAVLHSGPRLTLREAWRASVAATLHTTSSRPRRSWRASKTHR